jgi:hypothetical protein
MSRSPQRRCLWACVLVSLLPFAFAHAGAEDDLYYIADPGPFVISPLANDTDIVALYAIGYGRAIPGHVQHDWQTDYYTFVPDPGASGHGQHLLNLYDTQGQQVLSYVFFWYQTKPGDFTGDNVVDDDDLSVLLANWMAYRPYRQGNAIRYTHEDPDNHDAWVGEVNEEDLSLLLSWWLHDGQPSVPVPEPIPLTLLTLGSVALCVRRPRPEGV